MKRFYKTVTVGEQDGAFSVLLDGRPIKAPSGAMLSLPTRALAQAIADEWNAAGEAVELHAMPLTRLGFAATDSTAKNRAHVLEQVTAFARSDLLAYRAESPAALIARQASAWDPYLDWVAARHGARLKTGNGIAYIEQSAEALSALEQAVRSQDDLRLAALHAATTLTGSLVLGLALVDGRTDANTIFGAATLDEVFQAESWGIDAEAQARLNSHAADLAATERFVRLLA